MQEGLERILRVFDDTAGQAALTHVRWEAPAADPGPRARNLSLLLAALRDQELTVLTIQPPSYEALYALTSVPVLTCLVVLYFDGHEVTPLARDRLLSLEPALLAEYAANVSVHTIEQLSSRSGVYSVRTLDGLTVEGLPTDDITGQVFPAERPDGWEGYAQVVGHFTVTRLSPFDIQSHLEEWFHQLPYLYGVPRSRQAR